ncbi:MAG: Maf family protein [Lachnospiraceae bacterium]|nr:Maf family protein [Lachnospiraceae bacterium]
MRIILASASPRRRDILTQAGIGFEVCASTVEEHSTKSIPFEIVEELSAQKALDVAERYPADVLVIGADTVVAIDAKVLGKPKDTSDAISMLRMLSGRTHQVFTGVTLRINGVSHTFHVRTDVCVVRLSEQEITDYINSGEPFDKAGAYAIQGLFGKHITEIHGEYNNVVGLPIAAILAKCKALNIPIM